MQEIYIYIDDSGVLHKNATNKYFVYAGYIFISSDSKDSAKREYKTLNKKIRKDKKIGGELKACNINKKNRNSLYKVLKKYESLSVVVEIDKVFRQVLENKKSIIRFKDYALKRVIKSKIKKLLNEGKIDSNKDVSIFIFVDNQNIATNGYYDLKESIYEELKNGIFNFNYGKLHKKIFNKDVKVVVKYCDSKNNYLIQASDILANRIYNSYEKNHKNLRKIPNHINLTLP